MPCFFEEGRNNSGPLISVTRVVERVSESFKTGQTSVKKITREKFSENRNLRWEASTQTDIDSFQEDAIWRHIYEYDEKQEFPTKKNLVSL